MDSPQSGHHQRRWLKSTLDLDKDTHVALTIIRIITGSGLGTPRRVRLRVADEAEEFATDIARLHRAGHIRLVDAVFVTSDDDGVASVTDRVADMPIGEGAVTGGAWGVLAGILIGAPLLGVALGSGLGALLSRLIDRGVPRAVVDQMRRRAVPGRTIVILLATDVDHAEAGAVIERHHDATIIPIESPASG